MDSRNLDILESRIQQYNRIPGPRIGDFIRFADGTLTRITHDWGDWSDKPLQTMCERFGRGSFYLGNGYITYSGSLDPGIRADTLRRTDEQILGSVWFFHHDHARAHNGVDTQVPFRVYESPEEAPR